MQKLGNNRWAKILLVCLLDLAIVGLTTGFISVIHTDRNFANVCMIYLLAVTATALFLGSVPAVVASIISILAADFFFVEPRYEFTVRDPSEWLALCVFLIVATVTGQLTALLRKRAEEASKREMEAAALSKASWPVVSELDRDRALYKVLAELANLIGLKAATIYVLDQGKKIESVVNWQAVDDKEALLNLIERSKPAVNFVLAENRPIGWDDSPHWGKALPNQEFRFEALLPITVENQMFGVLHMCAYEKGMIPVNEKRIVESLLNYAAVVLQRDKLMKTEAEGRALAEADRLKTALLSMVSHDFRSPLTSIKASVGSLLDEGAPVDLETQKSLLQVIDHEADRINKMVGNVLDLSRLEAGAWRPRQEMSLVAEIVGAALDSFNASDNRRIEVNLQSKHHEIYVDSIQIVQVLNNLLGNALKYSPADSLVELSAFDESNHFVFEVRDRGQGLPEGEEVHIFEPFFRGSKQKESSVPGTGVGLAICRGLVESHGGRVAAYNRGGGGAVFRVTLPLSHKEEMNSGS